MTADLTRRSFLAGVGGAAAIALVSPAAGRATEPVAPPPAPPGGTTIVFQGDSITDCGRDRNDPDPNTGAGLATGYPLLVSAGLLREHPDRGLRFFNRGVSGNRVPDLQQRWGDDTLVLAPDVVSILIGVNDLWHKFMGRVAGTVEEYEAQYTALLEETRQALPNVRLVVLEPFVLRTGTVDDRWFPEFDQRRAAAARVSRRAGATFVPLQSMFDRLARRVLPAYWAADGVHPTPAGHAAIAAQWRHVVHL
jgi:lysophospholipase L1-like esterase